MTVQTHAKKNSVFIHREHFLFYARTENTQTEKNAVFLSELNLPNDHLTNKKKIKSKYDSKIHSDIHKYRRWEI